MPSFTDTAGPASTTWAVVRGITNGDHPRKTFQFFDAYYGDDHPDNVYSDLSASTWASSVGVRGELPLVEATVVVDLDTAEVTPTLTDEDIRLLPSSTYTFDLVENPGTTTETSIIVGRMTISGRATA